MAKAEKSETQGHLWKNFAEGTSLHACGHTVNNSKPLVNRLWWTLIAFALLIALVFTVTEHLIAVAQWPSKIKTRVEYLSSMDFPTVTFCNSNGLDKMKINKTADIENLMAYVNPTFKHLVDPGVLNNPQYQEMTQEYFYRNMSITKKDHIIQARFGLEDLDLDYFEHVDGVAGLCFRFNSAELIAKHGAIRANANGPGNSLSLLLNIHQEKYYAGPHSHAAMMIYINHPSHKQSYLDPVILVPPGSTSYIGLTTYKHKLLSPPYKSFGSEGCLDTEHSGFINPLKYSSNYSFGACLGECYSELIADNCGCKTLHSPDQIKVPYCKMEQAVPCASSIGELVYLNITSQRQLCRCLKPCTFYVYNTKLSHGQFPSLAATEYMVKANFVKSAEYARNNLLEVQIFFEQLILNTVEHVPEYPFTAIISTVGGAMGFYLGASVASLYEFLETCMMSLWLLVKKLIPTRKIQNSPVSSLK